MTFDTEVFRDALLSFDFLNGALVAVSLAVAAQALAIIGGFLLMLARRSPYKFVTNLAFGYIWFFRAMPTLLILLLAWNAAPQLFPSLTSDSYTPFIAALIGFAIVESAYMAEILRSAMSSIDEGQQLAARALGMSPGTVMVRVMIPQLIRVAIPPTGNEFIGMVKYTSLASVIGLRELMSIAQAGVSVTFSYAEYYAAAMVYYLVIVSVLMVLQAQLEKKYQWDSKARAKKNTSTPAIASLP
jgi:polar amino acid transport system permease protein